MPGLFSSLLIFSCLFLSVSFFDFFFNLFFVASIFLSLIFSAYVCHVTTAGYLGDQLKCDNQSNQSIKSAAHVSLNSLHFEADYSLVFRLVGTRPIAVLHEFQDARSFADYYDAS